MISLYVLVISTAVFRIAGFLGVRIFGSFTGCLRYGFAVMFLFTGISHFTSLRDDFVRMIPFEFLRTDTTVYATGALEISGALWLAWGRYLKLACLLLIAFLIAVLPANIYASLNDISLGGRPPSEMYSRVLLQIVYVTLLAFVGFSGRERGGTKV